MDIEERFRVFRFGCTERWVDRIQPVTAAQLETWFSYGLKIIREEKAIEKIVIAWYQL